MTSSDPIFPRPPVGGDPGPLAEREFARIAQLVHQRTGIVLGAAKHSMLVSRLSHRLRRLGLTDFPAYVRLLESAEGAEERDALVSSITTNVTRFFREPHHFAALARMAPRLLDRARTGERVRLWSAGCSTGEEAYSLAATLLDHAPDLRRHDLRILATDIDPRVIAAARRGLYDRQLVGPETPPAFSRFMAPGVGPDTFAIAEDLKALIRFEVLNLHDPWPFQGMLDVIFCRNVVIYFDGATRRTLWQRFADRLKPGGALFIGHSERVDAELASVFTPDGITQYRRSDAPAPLRAKDPHAHATPPERRPACR